MLRRVGGGRTFSGPSTAEGDQMKTDSEIQYDVMEELRLEPRADPSQIGVAAKNGVVTLSEFVRTFV